MLKIEMGLLPYGDGSGCQVTVTIEKGSNDLRPKIYIESIGAFDAAEWNHIKESIDRVLKATNA